MKASIGKLNMTFLFVFFFGFLFRKLNGRRNFPLLRYIGQCYKNTISFNKHLVYNKITSDVVTKIRIVLSSLEIKLCIELYLWNICNLKIYHDSFFAFL